MKINTLINFSNYYKIFNRSIGANIYHYSLVINKEPNKMAPDNSAIPHSKSQTDNVY
jgi:hypothetical protein